jgi:hypothetical protein
LLDCWGAKDNPLLQDAQSDAQDNYVAEPAAKRSSIALPVAGSREARMAKSDLSPLKAAAES